MLVKPVTLASEPGKFHYILGKGEVVKAGQEFDYFIEIPSPSESHFYFFTERGLGGLALLSVVNSKINKALVTLNSERASTLFGIENLKKYGSTIPLEVLIRARNLAKLN